MARQALCAAACLCATASWAGDVPRLAGTLIAPGHRAAVFDSGSGVMTSAQEGETVDGYLVQAIGAGGVRLERDGQMIFLHPAPSGAPAAPADTGGATFGLVLRQQPPPDD